jgi:hypothetical protein
LKIHPDDLHGGFADRWRYQYDSAGNQTCEYEYNGNGYYLNKTIYTYDNKGNCEETKDSARHIKWRTVFDSENNIIKLQVINRYDSASLTDLYKYDSLRNMTEYSETFQSETGKHNWQYIYDEKKNWIEKKKFDSGSHGPISNLLSEIEFRKTEYYK